MVIRHDTSLAASYAPIGETARAQGAEALLAPKLKATPVKTSAYTAVANVDLVLCDTTNGTFPVAAPASPADGDMFGVCWFTGGGAGIAGSGPSVTGTGLTNEILPLPKEVKIYSWSATNSVWTISGGYKSLSSLNFHRPSAKVQNLPARTVVTQMQSGHGFTAASNTAGGTSLNDTSDFVMGSQSAKIQTLGTGTAATLTNTAVTSFDTTGKQIRIIAKVDNVAHLLAGTSFTLYVANDSSFTNYWVFQISPGARDFLGGDAGSDWLALTLNWADAKVGAGAPTRTGIVNLRFWIKDDNTGNLVTLHVNELSLIPEPSTLFPNGFVVITADDCWESFYTLAKPILDAKGFPVTNYVIADQIGQSGRLTLNQLLQYQDLGFCEIAGHAYSSVLHNDSVGYEDFSANQVYEDLAQLKDYLVGIGARGADHFAYPHGQWNDTTVAQVRQFFASGRTIASSTHETYPAADFMRLRAVSSISSFTGGVTAATVNTAIQAAAANHGGLILAFHEIVAASPAATTQCLTSDFQSIVNQIASSGLSVLTMSQFLAS